MVTVRYQAPRVCVVPGLANATFQDFRLTGLDDSSIHYQAPARELIGPAVPALSDCTAHQLARQSYQARAESSSPDWCAWFPRSYQPDSST